MDKSVWKVYWGFSKPIRSKRVIGLQVAAELCERKRQEGYDAGYKQIRGQTNSKRKGGGRRNYLKR